MTKRRLGNALGVFKENPEMPDSECTLDYVLNRLVIWGGVETVAEKSSPCARRSALSVPCSTVGTTGLIPSLPGVRWNCWPPR